VTVPAAVLARLRAAVDPVYDGDVPLDESGRPLVQRYAVLFAAPGTRGSEDLGCRADRYTFRWRVTSVGEDRSQAEWVAVRCRDALLDTPITVDGWETGAVEHRSSDQIRRDEDIPGDPLFYAVDTYELPATR
jgi:hypothetical protein